MIQKWFFKNSKYVIIQDFNWLMLWYKPLGLLEISWEKYLTFYLKAVYTWDQGGYAELLLRKQNFASALEVRPLFSSLSLFPGD